MGMKRDQKLFYTNIKGDEREESKRKKKMSVRNLHAGRICEVEKRRSEGCVLQTTTEGESVCV